MRVLQAVLAIAVFATAFAFSYCNSTNTGLSLNQTLTTVGTCADSTGTHVDSNDNDSVFVAKWYCSPTYVMPGQQQTCAYTSYNCISQGFYGAFGGKCVTQSQANRTPVNCYDSDNSNYGVGSAFQASLAIAGNCTDAFATYRDSSVVNYGLTDVREFYCTPSSNAPNKQLCMHGDYYCPPEYSANGACASPTPTPTPSPTPLPTPLPPGSPGTYCSYSEANFTEMDVRLGHQGTCTDVNGTYADTSIIMTPNGEPGVTQYSCGTVLPIGYKLCSHTTYSCLAYGFNGTQDGACLNGSATPTPSPAPTVNATPTPVPTVNATPSATPSATAPMLSSAKNLPFGVAPNLVAQRDFQSHVQAQVNEPRSIGQTIFDWVKSFIWNIVSASSRVVWKLLSNSSSPF